MYYYNQASSWFQIISFQKFQKKKKSKTFVNKKASWKKKGLRNIHVYQLNSTCNPTLELLLGVCMLNILSFWLSYTGGL